MSKSTFPKLRRPVVECIWSGYRSSQERPCHRTVNSWYANILNRNGVRCIRFTDGTTMSVKVREANPREKVAQIAGYDQLLGDIARMGLTGYVSIDQVQSARAQSANPTTPKEVPSHE